MATLSEFGALSLLSPAALTASSNGAGVDLQPYTNVAGRNMKAILHVGAVSGTNPTMTVKMQQSSDNTNFSDIPGAAFSQKTTGPAIDELHFVATQRYVRAVATLGGTTPSFQTACSLVAQKRYV